MVYQFVIFLCSFCFYLINFSMECQSCEYISLYLMLKAYICPFNDYLSTLLCLFTIWKKNSFDINISRLRIEIHALLNMENEYVFFLFSNFIYTLLPNCSSFQHKRLFMARPKRRYCPFSQYRKTSHYEYRMHIFYR